MATVFVVGAGPAGLFAAKKIAEAGHQVVIFNRDIKPGGLAEYGIYPVKDKMKNGLRAQFAKIFALPNVTYFGHVPVGDRQLVTIEHLRAMSPAAMVFAVGAQGTKTLGLPGEHCTGVYAAKDFVYFYNVLPPFAAYDFSIGRRVAVIGMGNVMVDIARWLLEDDPRHAAEEVIVVARRGPFEAKFDEKEFAFIHRYFDREAFAEELARIEPKLRAVGQDPAKVAETTFKCLAKLPDPGRTRPRLTFRFLASPQSIEPGADGRIARLTAVENILVERNGEIAAKATEQTCTLDVDTMIFAIGDVVDPTVGLPTGPKGYMTNPDGSDAKRAAYEVFDPATGRPVPGMYVVGWARKASDGLVGIARHDGETGAGVVLEYLERAAPANSAAPEEIAARLEALGASVVSKHDLPFLERAEARQAQELGVPRFKFGDDATMLRVIEQGRAAAQVA